MSHIGLRQGLGLGLGLGYVTPYTPGAAEGCGLGYLQCSGCMYTMKVEGSGQQAAPRKKTFFGFQLQTKHTMRQQQQQTPVTQLPSRHLTTNVKNPDICLFLCSAAGCCSSICSELAGNAFTGTFPGDAWNAMTKLSLL